tara:strand:- start:117 stop:395 length:279 start_codon:yes stop_codon:yes gene_type:complete
MSTENKSITFDKKAQDKLPKEIRDKMNKDRDNASNHQDKGLNIDIVSHCGKIDLVWTEWNDVIQEIADTEMMSIDNRILRYLKRNFEPPKRK